MPTRNFKVSALDDIGNPDAPPGSSEWAKWMLGQAKLCRGDLERDVAGLQNLIKKLEKHGAWKALGFVSFAFLCQMELQLDDRQLERIKHAKRGQAIGAVLAAETAEPMREQGRPKEEQEGCENNGVNSTIIRGSTNSQYLAARIARDRPDVLERMKAGEFRSVRAAAIEAGIVKVLTPLEQIRKLLPKLTAAERKALAEEL
jgi:hypothetical protein